MKPVTVADRLVVQVVSLAVLMEHWYRLPDTSNTAGFDLARDGGNLTGKNGEVTL